MVPGFEQGVILLLIVIVAELAIIIGLIATRR
jgi:hypothetical protein